MSDFSSQPTGGGDRYVERSSSSIFSNVLGAVAGAVVGLVLLLAAPALLFWNESRAVEASHGLAEAGKVLVEVQPSPVDPGRDGRLIHLSGRLAAQAPLADEAMNLSLPGTVYLSRKVEMYQWKEDKETRTTSQLGGGKTTETTTTYKKVWSDRPIDSSGFRGDHRNPEMPVQSASFTAPDRTIGARTLAPGFAQALGAMKAVAPPQVPPEGFRLAGKALYQGDDPAKPQVGDVRVSFSAVPDGEVSVIGEQRGATIAPFATRSGYSINQMAPGDVSARQMLADQARDEATLTWILRAAGFVVFVVALALVAMPLAALANVLPFLGSLVEGGIVLFAVLLAIPLTLLVIGLAWIAVRPLLGIGLLAAALLATVAFVRLRRRRRGTAASAAGVPLRA